MTNPDFFFADDDVSTGPGFYPDGLTPEAITAVQRDVDRELRREGYPVRDGQRPTTRRSARSRVEPGADRTCDPADGPIPESCASPLPGVPGQPGGTGAAEGAGPSTGKSAGDLVPTLFTPTQAAELLQVPESWLRRRAARRLVPCTFLGKHLRFSRANLNQIIAEAARPAATRRSASDTGTAPRRRGRPPLRTRTDSHRPRTNSFRR
jgi:excisionase family DNA binding protein